MKGARGAATAVLTVLLAVAASACSASPGASDQGSLASLDDVGLTEAASTPGTTSGADLSGQSSIDVRSSDCPPGWTGLGVASIDATDPTVLGEVVACTDPSRSTTYLENTGTAVWLLGAAVPAASAFRYHSPTGEALFLQTVRAGRSREAIAPGSQLTIALPPTKVTFDVDLPLTYAWEGESLMVGKLDAYGDGLTTVSLAPDSQAGEALTACTVALEAFAAAHVDLAKADPVRTVLQGLGVSETAGPCRTAASEVVLGEPAYTNLADELALVGNDPQLTTLLTKRLRGAAAAAEALRNDVRLLLAP